MLELKYPSQRLAYPYYVTMVILFVAQVFFGLLLALQHLDPLLLQGVVNFNIGRAAHLNLAVVWIVTGIAGTLIFVGPLIAGRELSRPWVARLLIVAIWIIVIWNGFTLPLAQQGVAGWALGQPWLQEGLEYLEAGRIADVLLLIGFAALAYLIIGIFPRVKLWNEIHWGLAIGLIGLTVFWIFGMFFVSAIDLQEYFRWYVVHYWVEGMWEILHVCLVGFLLYALLGADLRIVRFAVFWDVTFIILAGLLGNAHHYFWIGTPAFWQFWGSLFSALEPVPMLLGMWYIYLDARGKQRPLHNRPAFWFTFGSVLLEQVGAGILGFTQTFALTNLWEHGTWVTAAHAHVALFGTFGLLVIGGAYAALPAIKGIARFDDRTAILAFWLLMTGLLGITTSFAFGGTVEIYVYRVLGLDWFGAELRPALHLWRDFLGVFALVFATGVALVAYDLLTLKETSPVPDSGSRAAQIRAWGGPMSAFEVATWLGALWFFGGLITAGLFSFNLASIRSGDPSLPYLLAGIGYPGLMVTTMLLAYRFLRAFDQRQQASAPLTQATPSAD